MAQNRKPQERKPRERSFIRGLVPDSLPGQAQVQSAIRIAVVSAAALLLVLLVLYLISRRFDITLLALLKVLAVPITVGAAVPLLNWLQKKRELDVENERAQDEALQAYLDAMDNALLRPTSLAESPAESTSISRELAQARTTTVIARLDAERNRIVTRFLRNLHLTRLGILREADLADAELAGAFFEDANLAEADLRKADLRGANLRNAVLSGANLIDANLSGANLGGANLIDANLIDANLGGAFGITNEKLEQQGASLERAIMPDGQKYEDWLKSKGSEEDGKNE